MPNKIRKISKAGNKAFFLKKKPAAAIAVMGSRRYTGFIGRYMDKAMPAPYANRNHRTGLLTQISHFFFKISHLQMNLSYILVVY